MNFTFKIKSLFKASAAVLFLLGIAACNKEFTHKIDFNEPDKPLTVDATKYKVAYIVVEGGIGTIVGREATDFGAMPTLASVSINSIVSWNAVSATNRDNVTAYADLMTGVELPKHQVVEGGTTNNLITYPTLFKRIADNTDARLALITSNNSLASIVEIGKVDNLKIVTADDDAASEMIAEIQREDAGVAMVTFKDVATVGQSSGFDSPAYITALAAFDQRLKSIVNTIHSRERYANERWLIIVTSNKGGFYNLPPLQNDGSVFSDVERNNFVVINNVQFAFRMTERMETVDPAWTSSAVRYTGSGGFAALDVTKSNDFNFGSGNGAPDFTLSFKLKVLAKPASTSTTANGVVIGKQESAQNSSVGWSVMYNGHNGWRFTGQGTHVVDNAYLDLNTWYALTAKVYKEGGVRYAKVFRNGVQVGSPVPFSSPNLTSQNIALQLGYKNGSYGNNSGYSHIVADVRIYDIALPDAVITGNSCSTMAFPSDPYYSNLMAYWPGNDNNSELRDKSGKNRHLTLQGSYAWTNFSERGPNICPSIPPNPDHYVLRSVDIPRMIYNWLNIRGVEGFNLDSQIWNPTFNNN